MDATGISQKDSLCVSASWTDATHGPVAPLRCEKVYKLGRDQLVRERGGTAVGSGVIFCGHGRLEGDVI